MKKSNKWQIFLLLMMIPALQKIIHSVIIEEQETFSDFRFFILHDWSIMISEYVVMFMVGIYIFHNYNTLEKTERKLEEYFQHSTSIIYVLDRSGCYLRVNEMAYKIRGYLPEEYKNKSLLDDISTEYKEKFYTILNGHQKESLPFEFSQSCKNGEVCFLRGEFVHSDNELVGFFQDITSQKSMQLALEKAIHQYKTLFEKMASGFAYHEIICDEHNTPIDYRFLEVNPTFEKITGLSADKVIGRCISQVFPNVPPNWIKMVGNVALGYGDLHCEGPALNGIYTAYCFCPEPKKFAILFNDITSRKKMEMELSESRMKYFTLFETAQDAIFIADCETKSIVEANSKALEITQYTKNEIQNMYHDELHPPETREQDKINFLKACHDPKLVGLVETELLTKNKIRIPVEINASIYHSTNGRRYIVGIFRNITARKKYEQELYEAKESLEKSTRIKSSFLSVISHELNTPLNPIINLSSSIAENLNLSNEIRENAKIIYNKAFSLEMLFKNIIEFSKIDSEAILLNPVVTSLEEIMEHSKKHANILLRKHEYHNKKIIFQTKLSSPSCNIVIDRCNVCIILEQLISNAIKFSTNGTILCECSLQDKYVCFSVSDQGCGILPEDQPYIYDVFFVSRRFEKIYSSLGLGLPIAKKIIEAFQGNIRFKTTPNQGTTFYVELPYTPCTRKEIILVEPLATNRQMITILLQKQNYHVVSFDNKQNCLEYLQKNSLEHIIGALLDFRTSGTLAKDIRNLEPSQRQIKIVVQLNEYLVNPDLTYIDCYVQSPVNFEVISQIFQK